MRKIKDIDWYSNWKKKIQIRKIFTPQWQQQRDTLWHVLLGPYWGTEEIEWQARSITNGDNYESRKLQFYSSFACV